jgi:hypothetical protein
MNSNSNRSWRRENVRTPIDYYASPPVTSALLAAWGCPPSDCREVSLVTPEAGECLARCTVEYLAVLSRRVAVEKNGQAPVKSIVRSDLPSEFRAELERGDGAIAINQPLGYFRPFPGEDGRPLPDRTTFFLDIDIFHPNPTWIFDHPLDGYRLLESTYQVVRDYLRQNRIDAAIVSSGRGYHVVAMVPHTAPAMRRLLDLKGQLSPEIIDFLAHPQPHSKRSQAIPINTERVFWGARKLENFMYSEILPAARARSEWPVTISDPGEHGIALDPTSANRNTETATMGAVGSLYTKPQVLFNYAGPYLTRKVRAVVLNGRAIEYGDLKRLLQARQNYQLAVDNIEWFLDVSPGGIPDASRGIERLIERYERSRLVELHHALDRHEQLSAGDWEALVHDLSLVAFRNPRVGRATAYPYPNLLDPNYLKEFVAGLYAEWRGTYGLLAFKRIEQVLSGFYYNNPAILSQFHYEPVNWQRALCSGPEKLDTCLRGM